VRVAIAAVRAQSEPALEHRARRVGYEGSGHGRGSPLGATLGGALRAREHFSVSWDGLLLTSAERTYPFAAAFSFAARFWACLKSRTSARVVASTTSAMERREPSSP
jgi:hypothetical protein